MTEAEILLIEGIANGLGRSQAGIGFAADASDANVFPTTANSDSALRDSIFDDGTHPVWESRLSDEAQIRIFIKTQTMSAKSDTSSFALEVIINGLTGKSSRSRHDIIFFLV
jgi:hypothetical protein